MTKYFVYVNGLHGPEGQIWYDKQTDGNGKAKPTLAIHELKDDDKRTLEKLKQDYLHG